MIEAMLKDFETKYPGKIVLTVEEVAIALDCPKRVVSNWIRRGDPNKRPPVVRTGKWIRIPVRLFVEWLIKDQEIFSKAK